jgi:hypothetical protein
MSLLCAIADFGLVSEYDDLVPLSFPQTSTHNLGTLNDRIPNKGVPIPTDKQYSIKLDCLALRDT